MLKQIVSDRHEPPTCVWVDAGLITYKLCDRNFDCERCPLDAALHGTSRQRGANLGSRGHQRIRQQGFPEDRYYCGGHTWLRPLDGDGRVRFGIDEFAASLMPAPEGLRAVASPHLVYRGQPLCEIVTEDGSLSLSSPIDACIARWNCALHDDPGALISAPYEEGWIVELSPMDGEDVSEFESRDDVTESAPLDFRRFLRRVGQELLLESESPGRETTVSNGHATTDLRRIIGGPRLLRLLRDFIH